MGRNNKILLLLSDEELARLDLLQTAFQNTSPRKISKSDILRRALFALPYQAVLL